MRIGMLVDVYKPYISGITNCVALTKQYFEKVGHEVFVFTFGEESHVDDEPNVIRSAGFPLVDTGYYISIRYNLAAQKLLRTMDIAHVHHPFLSGRLAIRYCRPHGIPIVFTNHTRYDLYFHAYLPFIPEAISETFLRGYLPSFCAACELVVAPSQGMKEVLGRFGVTSNVEVIPNGVDLTLFRNPATPIERSRLGFRDDSVIFIYIGRLGPEKNLNLLLRAFAGVARSFPDVNLLVLGGGSERDNLEDLVRYMGITDRVRFTGMVPYNELPGYLAIADAFVTASVTEVHPLSVIEAMMAGLPVLGIRSPGITDTVEDGVTGYIAPKEDLAALTEKMILLLTEPDRCREMGAQARQQASQYDVEQTTGILLQRFEQLVATSSGKKRGFRSRVRRMLGQ